MKKGTFKSPIKERLLPLPGSEIINTVFEKIILALVWVFAFVFFFIYTIELWRIDITGTVPNPLGFTLITILLGIYIYYKFQNLPHEIRGYAQGRKGEIYVGRILEGLRPFGYTPINDIPCLTDEKKVFNVDHVLVGPTGIFVIETKTLSKNARHKITYDNHSLDYSHGASALSEARRHAAHIGTILRERLQSQGSLWVYPILTFPGWWVNNKSNSDPRRDNKEVIVVNPKQIGPYLKDWEQIYSAEEIQKIVSVLSSYVFEMQDKLDGSR